LRLWDLFRRAFHFIELEDYRDHHAALMALFEILDITARSDVKSDLLVALERQRVALALLRENAAVAQEPLEKALADIESAAHDLHGTKGKFGEHLRNHEWLMSIKQRVAIPGGLCDFDLPGYHFWLSHSCDMRRQDLNAWIEPMLSTYRALRIQLTLLQDSGKAQKHVATRGVFQHGKVGPEVRLLRVSLDDSAVCVPEISANKYLLNIRFLEVGEASKGRLCNTDVPFTLTFCSL
jgi:cell division protein ZapD